MCFNALSDLYNKKVRKIWGQGSEAESGAVNEGPPKGPSAAEIQRQEEQRRADAAQERLVANAKEEERRRGRRATVISGVFGDPAFGSNVVQSSAYSLGGGSGGRTRLGG
jgi:hypothetical protein